MKFKSYTRWVNESSFDEGIIVLYPGGFKPMTGGHLELIKRYAEHPDVKEVRVLIGPGIRSGIDQDKAVKIAERLTSDLEKVSIEGVEWPSPVLTAYKIIGEADPGVYALAASSKGEDYKRVQDFVRKHQPDFVNKKGISYSREKDGVYVVELPLDVNPLEFAGRDDEYEGNPISASVLRNDIVNDDFDNFVTGYPESDPEDIQFVWDELAETVMNESQFTSGIPTQSSFIQYDRSQPGYFYKNMHMISDSDEGDPDDISEGGAAGHMMSPWEATDMTFGEIRELIFDALGGKLENVTEKLDGQNIMATVKDGEVYLARTQKQMANRGEFSIKWNEVFDQMSEKTPDFIKNAYQDAMNDLQTVVNDSKFDMNKIFEDGKRWLNMELLNPETENIVPYGEFQLRIHNLREVDEKGKTVDVIWESKELDQFLNDIEFSQAAGDVDKIHLIRKTNRVNFDKIDDIENIQEGIIRRLQSLMDENHLDDDNNIGDYIAQEIREWLKKEIKDKGVIEELVQRWAYGNKSTTITQILKQVDDKTAKWIREQDKKIDRKIGRILDPIIEIFSRVGIAVLQHLSGIAATNKDAVSKGIKKKAEEASKKIKEFLSRKDIKDPEDFEKKIDYLETQLRRIEQSGGLEGVAPIEGIVFEYKGKLFKLTGIYLPILKMINFFQFGQDKK